MAEDANATVEARQLLGNKVSAKVADLLSEIEKEPVPDRLMELALELQKALNEKLDRQDSNRTPVNRSAPE